MFQLIAGDGDVKSVDGGKCKAGIEGVDTVEIAEKSRKERCDDGSRAPAEIEEGGGAGQLFPLQSAGEPSHELRPEEGDGDADACLDGVCRVKRRGFEHQAKAYENTGNGENDASERRNFLEELSAKAADAKVGEGVEGAEEAGLEGVSAELVMGVEDQGEIKAVGRYAHDKSGRADDGEFGDAHGR